MRDFRRLAARVEVPPTADDPWTWALAMPYRALAEPRTAVVMPANPDSISHEYENLERRHRQRLAYYTALQSFLTYSFGWTRHDKGLLWWYENERIIDDARFALIRDIWVEDDTLSGYLAWVISRMEAAPLEAIRALRPWAARCDTAPAALPAQMATSLHTELHRGVWATGSDPMHLWGGHHAGLPSGLRYFGESDHSPRPARIVSADRASRSAIVVAESADGWYAQLADHARELPTLAGAMSWHVDVYVKPWGFVGTFRRSRDTGLWFSGRHRHHIVGN